VEQSAFLAGSDHGSQFGVEFPIVASRPSVPFLLLEGMGDRGSNRGQQAGLRVGSSANVCGHKAKEFLTSQYNCCSVEE
jgi:hypothetical protein